MKFFCSSSSTPITQIYLAEFRNIVILICSLCFGRKKYILKLNVIKLTQEKRIYGNIEIVFVAILYENSPFINKQCNISLNPQKKNQYKS